MAGAEPGVVALHTGFIFTQQETVENAASRQEYT